MIIVIGLDVQSDIWRLKSLNIGSQKSRGWRQGCSLAMHDTLPDMIQFI